MNKGWIKLWRKILDNPIFKDDGLFKCFAYCLLRANHEGKEFYIRDKVIYCEPGQFVTGRNEANRDLCWKSHRFDSAVDNLRKRKMLDKQTDKLFTKITVLNWPTYQGEVNIDGQDNGQMTDNRRTSDGQVTDTNKNDKNVKNDKNKESISHSDTKIFLSFYKEKFTECFGTEPQIEWGKDGGITKKLLKTIPLDELKSLLEAFFGSEDKFIQGSGYTIGVFKTQINKLKIGQPKSTKHSGLKEWAKEIMEEEDGQQRGQKAIFDSNGDVIRSSSE